MILQAAYGAVDLLVVGQFGSTAGLSGGFHRQSGAESCHICGHAACDGRYGPDRAVSWRKTAGADRRSPRRCGGRVHNFIRRDIFILLVGFARPISVLMQAPEEAVGLTASYVRICGGGIFFIVAYNLLSAIFRGLGDSRSPLSVCAGGLRCQRRGRSRCWLRGFGMDAAGAAIATVLAQAVSVVLAVVLLHQKEAAVCHYQRGLSHSIRSVRKFLEHRPAAGLAGVFDAAFVSGALRVRQPPGADRILRLWRCQQDRKLRHADPQRTDAVHGVVRRAECWAREISSAPKQSMFTGIGVGLVFGCVVFVLVLLKGDALATIFLDGCGGCAERL